MRTISHDAFARHEVQREFVHVPTFSGQTSCTECGSLNKLNGLFKYSTRDDDNNRPGANNPIRGLFCSIGCMRSYHS